MSGWTPDRVKALKGRPVYGRAASLLGTVTDVLFDPKSSKAWVAIDTGRSGAVVIVPLDEDAAKGGAIYVPLDREELEALSGRTQSPAERFYGYGDLP